MSRMEKLCLLLSIFATVAMAVLLVQGRKHDAVIALADAIFSGAVFIALGRK